MIYSPTGPRAGLVLVWVQSTLLKWRSRRRLERPAAALSSQFVANFQITLAMALDSSARFDAQSGPKLVFGSSSGGSGIVPLGFFCVGSRLTRVPSAASCAAVVGMAGGARRQMPG